MEEYIKLRLNMLDAKLKPLVDDDDYFDWIQKVGDLINNES